MRRQHDMPVDGYLRWPRVSMLELAPDPAAPSCARLHTRNMLGGWGLPRDMIADAETCVSETITNALRAAVHPSHLKKPQEVILVVGDLDLRGP